MKGKERHMAAHYSQTGPPSAAQMSLQSLSETPTAEYQIKRSGGHKGLQTGGSEPPTMSESRACFLLSTSQGIGVIGVVAKQTVSWPAPHHAKIKWFCQLPSPDPVNQAPDEGSCFGSGRSTGQFEL